MTAAPDRPVFLLTGFASEYSLGPLANLLRQAGEDVVEVDFSIDGIPDLGNAEIVLITSQHPARTAWVFKRSYGRDAPYDRYLSPIECMQQLNVRCSVFVPHDLEQPLIADEIGYLSCFDFYCSPYELNPGMALCCQPLYTGWAKHVDSDTGDFKYRSLAMNNGVFFVNQLIELMRRGGSSQLLRDYAAFVKDEVPFKLPRWPGVSGIEMELEQSGAKVIPADTASTRVISGSSQVYANASGSVLAEAIYLGVPTHIVAPGTSPRPAPPRRRAPGRRFDFELLMHAIRNHLGGAERP